jgi:hypothetical protein
MPHEVPRYAADNRTFYAAACLRIIWESECHGGKAEEARSQKRPFHEFLLFQALKPLRCTLVHALRMSFAKVPELAAIMAAADKGFARRPHRLEARRPRCDPDLFRASRGKKLKEMA